VVTAQCRIRRSPHRRSACSSNSDQRLLVNDQPRDALINRAVGFILSAPRPRQGTRTTAQHHMDRQMSARSKQLVLETRIAPAAVAASASCLAPGNSDSFQTRSRPWRPGIQSAQVPGWPGSFHGDPCPLFAASRADFFSDRVALRREMSRGGEDQRQVNSSRGVSPISRVNTAIPMLAAAAMSDRRIARPSRHELDWKALNDAARQRGPLAHGTHDIKRSNRSITASGSARWF